MRDVNVEATEGFRLHFSATGNLSLVIVAPLILSGCADFSPVKEHAALSKLASAEYSGIVEDMYQSCFCSAEFDVPDNKDTPEKHCIEWMGAKSVEIQT
jgi:hypothetical protein